MFYNGFPSIGNSDHIVVSVSIDFLINSKRDASFHYIAYDYSRADRDGPCDHLRDAIWEHIFKLSSSTGDSEFCEWVQVGIDVYIPYITHLHGFQKFVYRIFFFLYQHNKSSESKVKFKQTSNSCERVFEGAKLA